MGIANMEQTMANHPLSNHWIEYGAHYYKHQMYYYGDVYPAYAKVELAIERNAILLETHYCTSNNWLNLPVTVYSICVIERDK